MNCKQRGVCIWSGLGSCILPGSGSHGPVSLSHLQVCCVAMGVPIMWTIFAVALAKKATLYILGRVSSVTSAAGDAR